MTRTAALAALLALALAACSSATQAPGPAPTTVPPSLLPPTASQAESPPPEPTVAAVQGLALQGAVWEDRCDPSSPATCTQTASGAIPNGMRDSSEAGIGGVRVDLGQGACPAAGFASATTGAQGGFEFADLEPGQYCLSVESAGANAAVLGAGQWSQALPLTLTLTPDTAASTVELGWQAEGAAVTVPGLSCTDAAAFSADVTVPDGTPFRPGDSFVKTWSLRNVGTCTWGEGYAIVFGKGEKLGGPDSQTLPSAVPPGGTVELSVDMTAPSVAGPHQSNWLLRNANGATFGVGNNATDFFWVVIQVTWVSSGGEVASAPTAPAGGATSTCPTEANADFENQVLQLINAERVKQGLNALVLDPRLSAAARGHSVDMGCAGLTGHIGSDGSDWYGRITAQGYPYKSAYENVYFGSVSFGATPQGAFTWWMNSQVHRDNILNPKVTEIGVGYSLHTADGYGYYTVNFATR